MTVPDLKKAIQEKMNELEVAIELNRPQPELIQVYRQLKELHFQRVMLEVRQPVTETS